MAEKQTVHATWNETSYSFSTALPEFTGRWIYRAAYPAPEADGSVEFGSSRTQKGNDYNSKYDLMRGTIMTEAPAGKTDDGKDIIFDMTRETAIAYFHFTSKLAEKVVSAKLSVTGGSIANSSVTTDDDNRFVFSDNKPLNEITITFEEGTAPDATDFKLWYNVCQTSYSSMTLEVETTGHTMTISRNSAGAYYSGKLYKVVKDIADDKWIAKGGETPKPTVIEDVLTADKFKATGTTYTAFTGVKATSPAVYAGSTAKNANGAIQLRSSKSTDGIVTTTSGGSATHVSVVWGKGNAAGRTIDIYGKSTAYSKASDLYATQDGDQGTKIGSIICGTSTELVIEGDYPYIGIRSNDGALYLDSITITWGDAKTALETPANLRVSAEKVVSWNAVSGAASYEVTIGEKTFTSETTSYDAAAIADDYYDVAVVAVPSDKENYKNSAAATLTGVKFGTPKLTTPKLTEGAIDETSIRVNMTVDDRATNGCTCEIYKGETLVESKTIKVNYVVFSGLESGVTYTIKVNAIAVDGEKPYAASDVASIELKTKPAQHVSDVTAAGTYTIKGLTVYAVANTSVAIAGDNTGYILVYKRSHGLIVGNTFDAAGNAELYNGVWKLNSPSITNIKNGETPIYPNAVEATEDYLNAYASSQKIQYVHIKGTQTGKYIEVGGTKVFMETPNTEMEGKVVDAYGFVYGYHTRYNNAYFVVTSIKEDQTIPTLSVNQTSKVWAADATDAFVVNVTVNSEGGDWKVTPETLSWATIAVDKAAGTISITPNGANETETANEATLTVTHASDASLTKEITLKQNAAGGAAVVDKTATINFGTKKVNINKASITGDDSEKNSWTITTVGTTSFSSQLTFSQVGSKDKPAKSITFTTTLPEDAEVTSISAKFGGNGSTAGTITLKVGETIVGTGALNGTNDVTVTSTSTAVGNKVTITVTNIARGVKCYNIQVKYKTAN